MIRLMFAMAIAAVGLTGLAADPAAAQNVKITPLGGQDGEF